MTEVDIATSAVECIHKKREEQYRGVAVSMRVTGGVGGDGNCELDETPKEKGRTQRDWDVGGTLLYPVENTQRFFFFFFFILLLFPFARQLPSFSPQRDLLNLFCPRMKKKGKKRGTHIRGRPVRNVV